MTTFSGAPRLTGMTALIVLDQPMIGESFLAVSRRFLRPKDVGIPESSSGQALDNPPAHKGLAARIAIEAVSGRMLSAARRRL